MTTSNIIAILVALTLFVLIIWNMVAFLLAALRASISGSIEDLNVSRFKNSPQILTEQFEPFLKSNFQYYNALNEKQRIKFLLRLKKFIGSKTFSGHDGLEVTDEMKIHIAAAAVQITFGLERFLLNHFTDIFIYPDIFHNATLSQHHKGETSIKGYIKLSWKHFKEGYHNSTDKINLGLHEMAHALDMSRFVHESDSFFLEYYNKWFAVSKDEFDSMQTYESFLRDYGSVNYREFFAVCVEHFFEAPAEFKAALPDVYLHLCILLRQDPLLLNSKSSSIESKFISEPKPDFIKATPQFSSSVSYWDSSFAIIALLWRTVITTVIIFAMFKANFYIAVIVILLIVYYLNTLLYTVFEIYGNYLVLRRPLMFNKTKVFDIRDIISFEMHHRSTDYVALTWIEKGIIKEYGTLCSISKQDELQLLDLLAERKIFVRRLFEKSE